MVVNAGCCGTQGIVATSTTLDVVLVCNRPVAPLPETCLVVSNPATQLPLNATVRVAPQSALLEGDGMGCRVQGLLTHGCVQLAGYVSTLQLRYRPCVVC